MRFLSGYRPVASQTATETTCSPTLRAPSRRRQSPPPRARPRATCAGTVAGRSARLGCANTFLLVNESRDHLPAAESARRANLNRPMVNAAAVNAWRTASSVDSDLANDGEEPANHGHTPI